MQPGTDCKIAAGHGDLRLSLNKLSYSGKTRHFQFVFIFFNFYFFYSNIARYIEAMTLYTNTKGPVGVVLHTKLTIIGWLE